MNSSQARIPTENASRYLAQLLKHFKHKIEAEWTETEGRADFAPGECRLTATASELVVDCLGEDAQVLGKVKFILEDHIVRFGWREKLSVTWVDSAEG